MQAAATRPAGVRRLRRTDRSNATPHVAAADDTGLLDALPIAAAVIDGRRHAVGRRRTTAASSSRSSGPPAQRSTGIEADMPEGGPIAELHPGILRRHRHAPASSTSSEGEGVAAQYFRLKLAPLPRRERERTRCLLQCRRSYRRGPGGTHAARRDAARQPDRPAQPARLQRSDREGRRKCRPRPRACRAGRRHAALQSGSTNRWAALPATSC